MCLRSPSLLFPMQSLNLCKGGAGRTSTGHMPGLQRPPLSTGHSVLCFPPLRAPTSLGPASHPIGSQTLLTLHHPSHTWLSKISKAWVREEGHAAMFLGRMTWQLLPGLCHMAQERNSLLCLLKLWIAADLSRAPIREAGQPSLFLSYVERLNWIFFEFCFYSLLVRQSIFNSNVTWKVISFCVLKIL